MYIMKRTFFLIGSLFAILMILKFIKPTRPKKETTDSLFGRIDCLWDDLERRMAEIKENFKN